MNENEDGIKEDENVIEDYNTKKQNEKSILKEKEKENVKIAKNDIYLKKGREEGMCQLPFFKFHFRFTMLFFIHQSILQLLLLLSLPLSF